MYRNVLIFSFLIGGFLFAQKTGVEEIYEQRLYQNSGQDTLLYRWLAPLELKEGEQYPLVLFLHGSGERGNDNTAQLVHVMPRFSDPERRNKYPAYVFAPQCPRDDYWPNGAFSDNGQAYRLNETMNPTLSLTMEALTYMISIYPIDTSRIYVVGLSMGGAGAWELALRYANIFAAAVPICGFTDTRYAAQLIDLPIWAFHGIDDNVVSVELSRQMVKAVNQAGGKAIYTEFPGVGHDSWVPAFPDEPFIYDWLFSQKK